MSTTDSAAAPGRLPATLVERILQLVALSALAVLGLITLFIFREGTPLLLRVGLGNFLLGTDWQPLAGRFGVLPMIAGTAAVTVGALLLGLPLALSCSIVLAELAPRRARAVLRPAIELLTGLPSVVYGFVGLVVVVPWIRQHLGGPGWSVLAGAVILGIMILPTVIGVSVDALEAVPQGLRDASLALGATRFQAIHRVVLPAARSGLVAALVLGVGRAVGETMAVIMVVGNAVRVPRSPLDPARTLTANIALEMGGASGDHAAALFATAIVLFVALLGISALAYVARRPAGAPGTGLSEGLRRLLSSRPPVEPPSSPPGAA